MPTLIFYFPYLKIGGVSILFIRLARHLSKKYRVILVDIKDGFMIKNAPLGLEIITFDQLRKIRVSNLILITQTCPPWRLPCLDQLPSKTRIFFWNLHPNNLTTNLINRGFYNQNPVHVQFLNSLFSFFRKTKLRNFIRLCISNKAISFMDGENFNKTQRNVDMFFRPDFLPICTDNPKNYKKLPIQKRAIRCIWLGRIEEFKTFPLLHLLDRLNEINSLAIFLTIIGDGKDIDLVKKKAENQTNILCNFIKFINYDELDQVLVEYDIVFAMGASALEGAKLGIPTFCMNYSYQPILNLIKYDLITESKDYNLGGEVAKNSFEDVSSLEARLVLIMNNYEQYSKETFNYWKKNYSIEIVSKALITQVQESTLNIKKLKAKKLLEPDFFTFLKAHLLGVSSKNGWRYL